VQLSPCFTNKTFPACPEEKITKLSGQMVEAFLNSNTLTQNSETHKNIRQDIKEELHLEMCRKLAVISVELNKS
jgi:hypothetical protein